MGAVRTMKRRRLEQKRRNAQLQKTLSFYFNGARIRAVEVEILQDRVRELQARLADPEGTIQRGLNERYRNDMRQRELEHHASWDAEVVVHKMAAARWMRGQASAVATIAGDLAVAAEIEALPLVPES